MDVFLFILCLVAITTFAGIYREKVKAEAERGPSSEQVEARFQAMEERIRILERIVTDQKKQLKDSIDAL